MCGSGWIGRPVLHRALKTARKKNEDIPLRRPQFSTFRAAIPVEEIRLPTLTFKATCSGKQAMPNSTSQSQPERTPGPSRDGFFDTQTGVLFGIPKSAMCVQRFDDSLNSAIHITYRISLRSSSLREPRDPLSKVVYDFVCSSHAGRHETR